MNIRIASLLAIGAVLNVSASVDRLVKTYQPLYDPQADRIQIRAVYFLTRWSVPEAQVGGVCARNCVAPVGSQEVFDANLASRHGIRISCSAVKHGGTVSITVDLSEYSWSAKSRYPDSRYGEEQLFEAVIECLKRCLQDEGHTEMRLEMRGGGGKKKPQWSKYEHRYGLGSMLQRNNE
jgi:hypothetical protein